MTNEKAFLMVEARLTGWSRWYTNAIKKAMGWPPQSAFLNIISDCGTRGKREIYFPKNEGAEEIEEILTALNIAHPDWCEILKFEYTEPGTMADRIRMKGMKRATYRILLERGKIWVESRIKDE